MNPLFFSLGHPDFLFPFASMEFLTFPYWVVAEVSSSPPPAGSACRDLHPVQGAEAEAPSGWADQWAVNWNSGGGGGQLSLSRKTLRYADLNSKAGGGPGAANWHKLGFRLWFLSASGPASHWLLKEINQLQIDFPYHFHLSGSQMMLDQWTLKPLPPKEIIT